MGNKTSRQYAENVKKALLSNWENNLYNYHGEQGCLKLAREWGYGLNDFKKESIKSIAKTVTKSYHIICIPFYNGNPPVPPEVWIDAVIEGMTGVSKYDLYNFLQVKQDLCWHS